MGEFGAKSFIVQSQKKQKKNVHFLNLLNKFATQPEYTYQITYQIGYVMWILGMSNFMETFK